MFDSMKEFPTRRALLLVTIVAFLVPIVSARAAITVSPFDPHAGEVFDIAFGGQWIYISGGSVPTVEVVGDTIRVTLDVGLPVILPPIEVYAFSVEIGPLAAGQYRAELWVRETNTIAQEVRLIEQREFVVVPEASVRMVQTLSGLPSDYFLAVENPVDFRAAVFASCARLLPPIVDAAQRTIDVAVDRGCQILPPSPTLQELDLEASIDLEAGTWTVRLVDHHDSRVYTRSSVEVLPFPVTLRDGRFVVEVDWLDLDFPVPALPVSQPSADSALFWFFEASNWELMLKVLDGCALNGHFWVFGAAQTDRGYRLRVRDTLTDTLWEYENFAGTPSPAITDTGAFATCP